MKYAVEKDMIKGINISDIDNVKKRNEASKSFINYIEIKSRISPLDIDKKRGSKRFSKSASIDMYLSIHRCSYMIAAEKINGECKINLKLQNETNVLVEIQGHKKDLMKTV